MPCLFVCFYLTVGGGVVGSFVGGGLVGTSVGGGVGEASTLLNNITNRTTIKLI